MPKDLLGNATVTNLIATITIIVFSLCCVEGFVTYSLVVTQQRDKFAWIVAHLYYGISIYSKRICTTGFTLSTKFQVLCVFEIIMLVSKQTQLSHGIDSLNESSF